MCEHCNYGFEYCAACFRSGKSQDVGKNIERDIQMLECIESMHKNMEYEVSCEDPDVSYISIDGIRLIFENGVYKGWYVFKEETKYSDKQINIAKLEKTIKLLFSRYKPPCDVDIYEFNEYGIWYTKIAVCNEAFELPRRYIVIPGKIEYLAAMSPNDFMDILKTIDWQL